MRRINTNDLLGFEIDKVFSDPQGVRVHTQHPEFGSFYAQNTFLPNVFTLDVKWDVHEHLAMHD
ncbi:MAG TPA: hypothetical protein VIT44_07380, partial [Cyclobacteriaceae bacterium]